MIGSHADGNARFEQYSALKVSIRRLDDGPSVNRSAIHLSPEKGDTSCFLAHLSFSHPFRRIPSACLYNAGLDDQDPLDMYPVEEMASCSCLNSVCILLQTFHGNKAHWC